MPPWMATASLDAGKAGPLPPYRGKGWPPASSPPPVCPRIPSRRSSFPHSGRVRAGSPPPPFCKSPHFCNWLFEGRSGEVCGRWGKRNRDSSRAAFRTTALASQCCGEESLGRADELALNAPALPMLRAVMAIPQQAVPARCLALIILAALLDVGRGIHEPPLPCEALEPITLPPDGSPSVFRRCVALEVLRPGLPCSYAAGSLLPINRTPDEQMAALRLQSRNSFCSSCVVCVWMAENSTRGASTQSILIHRSKPLCSCLLCIVSWRCGR
jgi:hypothetical protein